MSGFSLTNGGIRRRRRRERKRLCGRRRSIDADSLCMYFWIKAFDDAEHHALGVVVGELHRLVLAVDHGGSLPVAGTGTINLGAAVVASRNVIPCQAQ